MQEQRILHVNISALKNVLTGQQAGMDSQA